MDLLHHSHQEKGCVARERIAMMLERGRNMFRLPVSALVAHT